MRCTKYFYQTKVVKNQNLQLLCDVIFFDILHHYGVIAASQICSVEKELCRLMEQIFSFPYVITSHNERSPSQSLLQEHAKVTYKLDKIGEEAAKGWSSVANLGYLSIGPMLFLS